MGLEIAELMLEVEERYAIVIDEDDVMNVETFGDLVDMVKRNIDKTPSYAEAESSYDIILAALLAELRTLLPPQMEFDENTTLKELKRYEKRGQLWVAVNERFPEMPAWMLSSMSKGISLGCAVVLVLPVLLGLVERGCIRDQTLADVAAEIVQKRRNRLRAPTLSAGEIESELREIICEQFGVREPEKITRETDLVKDLGLG